MNHSVINWLEITANRFPDKLAFSDASKCYTWHEIRKSALSIAYHIQSAISGSKQAVAVYMEKASDMLAVYLGIAYSGNFYSPIAVDMPSARVDKVLQTLQPALFITTKRL